MKPSPFHLSLPCKSLADTRKFYIDKLGFSAGRSSHSWLDLNLAGNQITFLESPTATFQSKQYKLSGKVLPIFHFGIILEADDWNAVYGKWNEAGYLKHKPVDFLSDQTGAHRSFFVKDPNGYSIEFKQMVRPGELFKSQERISPTEH